ncbi:DUF6889 family protein [Cronobacter sakazakii]|uniref:DUF6889 family protein n=1 Tax=Cronobacter sakazakii TaxID=28141 RepID=UPI003857AE70
MPDDAAATDGPGGGRFAGKFFARTPRRADVRGGCGVTLDTLPGGEEYILRPAEAFRIAWSDLKSGTVDLCDIALMNDWLDLKADNRARLERWREN